jgi:putative thiamine transport system permease protein
MILGPTTPATLAVRLTNWMRAPDLSLWFTAAAGAMLQLVLVLLALALWRSGEAVTARLGNRWAFRGGRLRRDGALRVLAALAALAATLPLALGLAGLALWSVAGPWPFPDALPARLDLSVWSANAGRIAPTLATSLAIAAASVALALALVIASLEAGHRSGQRAGRAALWMLYLPLIVPQIAFLFGLQMLGIALGADGALGGVIFAHLVFVLPYVYLSLADPWTAMDPRLGRIAASLGASPARAFLTVRLPLMLAPILTAAAVGFAVSIGLYLPTLLIGGGRVETLTTEAVALAAGGDRRLIGVYALLQMLAPFTALALALGLPALVWRNRAGMRVRP